MSADGKGTRHLTVHVVVGTGRLRAEGRVIHDGSRPATADARLTDLTGKLNAHAVGTCLIFTAR